MKYIKEPEIKDIVRLALKEDIGDGDITTNSIIPPQKYSKAVIRAEENCTVCGLGVAAVVFKTLDKRINFSSMVREGTRVKKGRVLARIHGNARSILSAERVALNFLSLLSAVATATRGYVNAVKPYKVKILDTRKTIPGLRILQKYAVRIGGGYNHRMCLDDMILVKDNHLQITDNYLNLPKLTHNYRVELEVKNLKEFEQALELKPDVIMLDNMCVSDMRKAVMLRDRLQTKDHRLKTKIEASGGITLKNIKKIASTGVDLISLGILTHSLESVDISLDIQ